MLTLDVLRSAKLKCPGNLSRETIVNLAENGVPHKVFRTFMEQGVKEVVEGLTQWDGRDAIEDDRRGDVANPRLRVPAVVQIERQGQKSAHQNCVQVGMID